MSAANGYGPVMRGRNQLVPSRSFKQMAIRTTQVLIIGALLLVLLGVGLGLSASASIHREPVSGLTTTPGPLHILVVGSDSRDGLSQEDLQQLGTEAVSGRRTDTIFLLSVSGGSAAMLSFPRDLYVTDCEGRKGRINAAYGAGGPSCLVKTVSTLTGVPISHYAEVNLAGFVNVVDTVGGVPVWLDAPMQDRWANVDLPAGCSILDGRQAIGFVRARHIDSDLGRIARQQRVIKTLVQQIISPHSLINVPRLFQVANAGGSSITADEGFGPFQLLRLGRAARGLAGGGIATYTVPTTPQRVEGNDVLMPTAEAGTLYAGFASGSVLTPQEVGDPSRVEPKDVKVRILNGTGRDGLANRAKKAYMDLGFQVTGIGNANPRQTSIVQFPPGKADGAQKVADTLGISIETNADLKEITLILGGSGTLPGETVTESPTDGPLIEGDAPSAPPPGGTQQPAGNYPLGAGPVPADCKAK